MSEADTQMLPLAKHVNHGSNQPVIHNESVQLAWFDNSHRHFVWALQAVN